MAYAVVTFYDDNLVSEVPTNWLHKDGDDYLCWWPPTNVKNVPVLISKRIDPDRQTWKLVEVNVERYCPSVEKARKVAEDKNYTSCDDSQLGKGCRNKIPKQIYSNSDEENERKENKGKKAQKFKRNRNSNCIISDSDSDNNNTRKSAKKTLELPPCPNIQNQKELLSHAIPLSFDENNDDGYRRNDDWTCQSDDSPISPPQIQTGTEENITNKIQKIKEEVYKIKGEMTKMRNDIIPAIKKTQENTETLMRMFAASDIHFTNIEHRLDNITPGALSNVSTDRVTKCLPLKDIDEILQIEEKLKNEGDIFIEEYKTFVRKIGGHTARENVRNALSQIFTNRCALQCSWKGRKENFEVASLSIVKYMRQVILDMHTNYTQKEFDEAASDWLRFAKQRFTRETKQREPNNE